MDNTLHAAVIGTATKKNGKLVNLTPDRPVLQHTTSATSPASLIRRAGRPPRRHSQDWPGLLAEHEPTTPGQPRTNLAYDGTY